MKTQKDLETKFPIFFTTNLNLFLPHKTNQFLLELDSFLKHCNFFTFLTKGITEKQAVERKSSNFH